MAVDYIAMGRRIRKMRREKGWTQEYLASNTFISASFLGHIERGTRVSSLETIVNIANSLQCGTNSILRDSLITTRIPIGNRAKNIRKIVNEIAHRLDEASYEAKSLPDNRET